MPQGLKKYYYLIITVITIRGIRIIVITVRTITIIGLIIRYCSYYDADLFIAGLQYADLRLQGGPIRYPLVVRVPKSLFWGPNY